MLTEKHYEVTVVVILASKDTTMNILVYFLSEKILRAYKHMAYTIMFVGLGLFKTCILYTYH